MVRAQTALVLAFVWIASSGLTGHANQPLPIDWERLPLTELVVRLDAPASGAFFARTKDGLLRSDDGGLAWSPVSLPEPRPGGSAVDAIIVDPVDHTVLYAEGKDGLYQSRGEPVQWNLVLPLTRPIQRVAVSSADPSIVYVAELGERRCQDIKLWRSDDRGGTWTEVRSIDVSGGTSCGYSWLLLVPDASRPDRIMLAGVAADGRSAIDIQVTMSTDRGATGTDLPWKDRAGRYPLAADGGVSLNPDRLYLLSVLSMSTGGTLRRSDDGGQTWTTAYTALGKATPASLAVDPWNPDRVFVGHRVLGDNAPGATDETPVMLTTDGGGQWAAVGSAAIGHVQSLRLGVDGAWLYAATSTGLWRYLLVAPA